jgi:gluconate 2-dehydrogenase gamma chain
MKGKRIVKDKNIKGIFSNIENWKINRRKFVKTLTITTVLSQISAVSSCVNTNTKVYQANLYLTALQSEIIQKIQDVLFPNDGNGPSTESINAYSHILWVLSDERKDKASIDYIKKGMDWVEETSQENYGRTFSDLSQIEIEELVAFMADKNWGASWLSMILTFIFEALSMDPIYGVNTNEVGWKWLGHQSGNPRPNKDNSYTNIFETIYAN